MLEFEKIDADEFDRLNKQYDFKLLWIDNEGNYQVVLDEGVVAVAYQSERNNGKTLELDNLEVLNQRSGIGRKIVNELKKMYMEITLYPSNDSNAFWEKMGFKYRDDGTGTIEMYYILICE